MFLADVSDECPKRMLVEYIPSRLTQGILAKANRNLYWAGITLQHTIQQKAKTLLYFTKDRK